MCTDTTRVADRAQSARLTAMRSGRHQPRPQGLRMTWSVPVRGKASGVHRPRDYAEASGYADRATATRSAADAVRYTSVTSLPGPPTAHKTRWPQAIAAALWISV
jgi:hypothetical protein